MYGTSGIRSYQETSIQSIGPERLITMLYEGIFRNLSRAEDAIRNGDISGRARGLNRALAIVAELKHSLDPAVAPELVARLASLYDYVSEELLATHLDGDPGHIVQARRVLDPLYEAWRAVPSGSAEQARAEIARRDGPVPAGATGETGADGTSEDRRPVAGRRELCVAV